MRPILAYSTVLFTILFSFAFGIACGYVVIFGILRTFARDPQPAAPTKTTAPSATPAALSSVSN
jgi:hypothetical protein